MKIHMRLFCRKSNGLYYVEFDRGKKRSLKTTDKREAQKIYAELKRQYLSGRLQDISGNCLTTLDQFYNEYTEWALDALPTKTFKANRLALRKLIHYAGGHLTIDKITLKHIDLLIADSRKNDLSVASINNYIRHAKSVLNKAVDWYKDVKINPIAKAKELTKLKKPPSFIKKSDLHRFFVNITDFETRRLAVAYVATGRRRTELFALDWSDIDFESARYYVRKSKTHLSRWYHINDAFLVVLMSIQGERIGKIFKKWQHPDTVTHKIKQALIAAGLPDHNLHHLRHSFANEYLENGGDLKSLQELLGHTEYRTTEIYSSLSEEHLQKETNRVKIGPVDLFE